MATEPSDATGGSEPKAAPKKVDFSVGLLLAVTAVLATVIGLRASVVGGEGGGAATSSIRADVQRGGGIVDAAEFLYGEDAPLALQVAEAQLRSDEANERAGEPGLTGDLLDAEAAAQAELAEVLTQSSRIVVSPEDAKELDADALMQRLAELRARSELSELDPEGSQAEAEDLRYKSSLFIGVLIPVAFGFLCGALAEGFPRRRDMLVAAGWGFVAISVILAIIVEVAA